MAVLVTGAAGFIGAHVCAALLDQGETVVGIDNLNTYYESRLKAARLGRLTCRAGFTCHVGDIADRRFMGDLAAGAGPFPRIVHLAAQAGVRHALIDPHSYVTSNLMGQLNMLELARGQKDGEGACTHFVYASSSSVYGSNAAIPFTERDRADTPISLYAATKRADELMSHAYAHQFGIPCTGLRFFTVYGPWGRPDMAYFQFARAIMAGKPITLFDGGRLKRDFTYIDDIVGGVLAVLAKPPAHISGVAMRLVNIGNHLPESVSQLVRLLERGLGRQAITISVPRPPTEIEETFADISDLAALTGFRPITSLATGIGRFVDWFKTWDAA